MNRGPKRATANLGAPVGAGDRAMPRRVGDARPTLAVVETLTLHTPTDPYLSLAALASYSSCSVRWLRDRLTDPLHPLPCFRLPGGKILVRRSAFDAWLDQYRVRGAPAVARIV